MKPQSKTIINEQTIENIAKECNVSALSALLLYQRGIMTKKDADKFFFGKWPDLTDPYAYNNMDKIVARLRQAVEQKQKIVVYGDYDCDGIGATAIYYLAFTRAGVQATYYIPTRKDEGYGLNSAAIDKIKETFDPDILLTADCGITSAKEIAHAKSLGLEVIVTDHHTPCDELPDCLYTDPCFTPELTQLCAAGVALYVVRALFGEEEALRYADVCAVSTIADIVPLNKDNRILVKTGLEKIHRGDTREGIKTLVRYARSNLRTLSVSDISFRIAPRLNAAGRLSTPIDSLRLLIEDDPTTLNLLAENLSLQNAERQQLSADIYKEAMEQLKSYDFGKYNFIMLCGKWNEGVVGIVCSRLTEFYHLPTILLSEQEDGTLCGSARSIEGVNLYELLRASAKYLATFGGHAMAAGLSLKKENFFAARDSMNETLQKAEKSVFLRKVGYDAPLPVKSVNWDKMREIELFAPFGCCNPAPVFYDEKPSLNFKRGSDRFPIIKARTSIGEAVSFTGLPVLPLLDGDYSLLYTVEKNNFNDKEIPQFSIKQFFISDYKTEDEEAFFENFLLKYDEKQPKKDTEKPVLYVCFCAETVKKILTDLPTDTPVYYKVAGRLEKLDSVVLSPSADFPYYFFGKIVFADLYHPVLASYAEAKGICTENRGGKRISREISIDYLRNIFVYYTKAVLRGRFEGFSVYYDEKDPSIGTKDNFVAASYILMECGLIKKDETTGELTVLRAKADPTETMLYKYVRGDL